jgi:hypothetical protein
MSDKGCQDGLLDDFEYPTIDGKLGYQNEERPNKHNSATEEAVGKVHV